MRTCRGAAIVFLLLMVVLFSACGEAQSTGSSAAEATVTALTNGKTGEAGYFVALAQISPVYGKVTNATITPQGGAKIGVAFDVMMNNPTQSRIKHVSHDILMAISLEQDVSQITINFHADGYTGMDDPIATSRGAADNQKWVALDDSNAWDEAHGIFNADLPA